MKICIPFAIFATLVLFGCTNTPEAKLAQAYKRIKKTPFEQWPYLYSQLEKEGKISTETRVAWTADWQKEKKERDIRSAQQRRELAKLEEKRRREWESMTPAQRYAIQLQEQQLAQQQAMFAAQMEQQRQANVAAALQNFSNNLQRQQEVNAYNARTQVLGQPLNVNVNGNIGINGTIYHRYGY